MVFRRFFYLLSFFQHKINPEIMKKIFLLAWLLIFIPAVNAQQAQYHFDHLSLEEGITHNLTYSILQDSKGFMWFGTFYGLIRHDGREYKNFKHIPFDYIATFIFVIIVLSFCIILLEKQKRQMFLLLSKT